MTAEQELTKVGDRIKVAGMDRVYTITWIGPLSLHPLEGWNRLVALDGKFQVRNTELEPIEDIHDPAEAEIFGRNE